MTAFFSGIALVFLWLLHWLPVRCTRIIGAMLGIALYAAIPGRRHVVMTNLRLCFPQRNEAWRRKIARRHFVAFVCSVLDHAYFWWSSRSRLEHMIRLHGREYLLETDEGASKRPTILLVPHFIGLDAAGIMMTMATPLVSVYSRQKNPYFNARMLAGRLRFNNPLLLSRQDGMRRVLKALKDGYPFFYLPDLDFGAKDAVFVSFFDIPAATISGVSRLARLSGAQVVPCVARMTSAGYDVTLMPPWSDYPGESLEADTRRMNAFIESEAVKMPEQYFWSHKRFKTRPPGEKGVY